MKPKFDHKVKRPNGQWVHSSQTDIRKTFAKARERIKQTKVTELPRKRNK